MDDDFADEELFNIDDVVFDIKQTKDKCKIYVIASSKTPFNLMKAFLAMEAYVDAVRTEIGIMAEDQLECH